MTRIPNRSLDDAPPASLPLLQGVLKTSPTGRLLNMHAQMAHAPAVLHGYIGLRKATGEHGTLDQRVRTALMLATAVEDQSEYALAVISMLALRSGWSKEHVAALRAGAGVGDPATDALIGLVREATANHGRVSDETWDKAAAEGWNDEQLAEAFAYLALTVVTSYFLNYAETELDLPAGN